MKLAENDPVYWLDEHAPKLVLYARQWGGSASWAEDIFQDAFVRFWRKRESVRDPVTYLYRCVRNTAINWSRSSGRRRNYEAGGAPGKAPPNPTAAAEQTERQICNQRALSELPADQREVVVMKIWGERTFSQISEVMSIPRSTAHATYRTAMNRLYEKLDREM